eukprot:4309104-Pyramimonas_sp.AAC.1
MRAWRACRREDRLEARAIPGPCARVHGRRKRSSCHRERRRAALVPSAVDPTARARMACRTLSPAARDAPVVEFVWGSARH